MLNLFCFRIHEMFRLSGVEVYLEMSILLLYMEFCQIFKVLTLTVSLKSNKVSEQWKCAYVCDT